MFQNKPVPRVELVHTRAYHVKERAYTPGHPWGDSIDSLELSTVVEFTKDEKGQISDDSCDVIEAVLNANVPSPTNPAVLLKAAREWYLAYGGRNHVLACILEQLCEVEGLVVTDFDLVNFKKARKEFNEAIHVQQPA